MEGGLLALLTFSEAIKIILLRPVLISAVLSHTAKAVIL